MIVLGVAVVRSARSASSSPNPPAGSVTTTFVPPAPPLPPEEDEEFEPERQLSFWDKVANVPEGEWWDGNERNKGYRIYCTDEEGPSTYFACVHEPIDLDWVQKNFGGGIYKFSLNNFDNKFLAQHKFRIEGESKRRKPVTGVQNTSPAALPSHDNVLIQFLEVMREEQRQTREMLREALSRNAAPGVSGSQSIDPTAVFRGMVDMFKEMFPRHESKDPIAQMIQLKELMGKPPDLLAELGKLKEAGLIGGNGGGMGDVLQQLTVVTQIAEKLGLQAGGGRSWAEILIEKGPEIMQQVRAIFGEYRAVETVRAQTADKVLQIQNNARVGQTHQPQPAPQPGPAANARPAQPQPPPGQAAPANAVNLGTPTLDVEPVGTPGQVVAEVSAQGVQLVKQCVVNMISMGLNGAAIVEWMDENAPLILRGFEGVPEDQLIQFFAGDPILAQAQQYPRFRQCIHELVEELARADDGQVIELGPSN